MGPIVWLDVPFAFLGMVAVILSTRRLFHRNSGRVLGTMAMLLLGVGSLAAAAIDVGLSQWWDKIRWSIDENMGGLRVGSLAPDFALPRLDDGKMIRLSDFRGRRPVCLILGSFS